MTGSGYHHVEDVMGMAVSIDVRDETHGQPGLQEVVAWLHHVDATFSTYKADSVISMLGRGAMSLADAGPEVRGVLEECEQIREITGGAFDAFAVPAPNGTTFDPSGLVKGWSVERAGQILATHGLSNFCINAGGDVVLRGCPRSRSPWRVGIRHPDDRLLLAHVLEVESRLGVATSATYERGAHIFDPRTGQPTTELASVTVIGPDLGRADAYATAVFVMGTSGLGWLESQPDYHGFVITHVGRTISTPGFPFPLDPDASAT